MSNTEKSLFVGHELSSVNQDISLWNQKEHRTRIVALSPPQTTMSIVLFHHFRCAYFFTYSSLYRKERDEHFTKVNTEQEVIQRKNERTEMKRNGHSRLQSELRQYSQLIIRIWQIISTYKSIKVYFKKMLFWFLNTL